MATVTASQTGPMPHIPRMQVAQQISMMNPMSARVGVPSQPLASPRFDSSQRVVARSPTPNDLQRGTCAPGGLTSLSSSKRNVPTLQVQHQSVCNLHSAFVLDVAKQHQNSELVHSYPIASPPGPLSTRSSFVQQVPEEYLQRFTQSMRAQTEPSLHLDKSYPDSVVDANHPSNLSVASALSDKSDIGYASTTSSEHANDPGVLSESSGTSRDSKGLRRVKFKVAGTPAQSHRPCRSASPTPRASRAIDEEPPLLRRSVSPTPSPRESAVPVPTKLCVGGFLSARLPSPEAAPLTSPRGEHSMLMMPFANQNAWVASKKEDAVSNSERLDHSYNSSHEWRNAIEGEEDIISRPEKLDKIYNSTYNSQMNGPPGPDAVKHRAISDALLEAEFARDRANAALEKISSSRRYVTPQVRSGHSTPPRDLHCHLPGQTPRFQIPSIGQSVVETGQQHGDRLRGSLSQEHLISWFADELGVSKDEAGEIWGRLKSKDARNDIATPRVRGVSGAPEHLMTARDAGFEPATRSVLFQEKRSPFASVLSARPPVDRVVSSGDDMFAPEPRMLEDSSSPSTQLPEQGPLRRLVAVLNSDYGKSGG